MYGEGVKPRTKEGTWDAPGASIPRSQARLHGRQRTWWVWHFHVCRDASLPKRPIFWGGELPGPRRRTPHCARKNGCGCDNEDTAAQ